MDRDNSFEVQLIDGFFGYYRCPAEWHVLETGSNTHRLYAICSGEAIYSDDISQIRLLPGYLYLFPINRAYEIAHNPENPMSCLYFHITTAPVILNSITQWKAKGSIGRLLSTYRYETTKGTNDKSFIFALLKALFVLMNREITLQAPGDPKLIELIEFMQIHSTEQLDNLALARMVGYDISYFSRVFVKTFGVSPQRYLRNYRISLAIQHIRENKTISEVASLAGYADTKAFSRAFKKARGIPPLAYRKKQFMQP